MIILLWCVKEKWLIIAEVVLVGDSEIMGKGRSGSGRFRPNAYKGKKDSNVRRFGRAIGKFVQSNNGTLLD